MPGSNVFRDGSLNASGCYGKADCKNWKNHLIDTYSFCTYCMGEEYSIEETYYSTK